MTKGKNRQPTRTHAKKGKPSKARENVGDQVTIKIRFASHWLRGCREFSGPTTERGKAKKKQRNPGLLWTLQVLVTIFHTEANGL